MVSTYKVFVYLNELPFEIESHAKRGYAHFRIDFLDTRKPRRERVVLRFWKDIHPAKNLICPDCDIRFNNSINLLIHQRKEHEPKALYSGPEITA